MEKSETLVEIGQRLRKQRTRMHLTQEDAAELLEMSAASYGAIERGEHRVSLETIFLIYKRMKLNPNYLLLGKGMENPEILAVFEECAVEKIDSMRRIVKYLIELENYS